MTARWVSITYILALSLAVFFLPGAATAQTYNANQTYGTPGTYVNTGNGGSTGGGETVCGSCVGSGSFQWVAAQFTLTQPTVLQTVQGFFGLTTGTGSMNLVIRTNNSTGPYPLPGTAIWSQTYQNVGASHSADTFVTFSNYVPILAPGTYWVSFEPPKGSGLNFGMDGPAANPLPPSSYAFYNSLNGRFLNFADTGNTNYPALTISGLTLTTPSGDGVATYGTAARTVTQGTVFDMFPFSQYLPPVGDAGLPRTLQWNIYSPAAESSAYGAISANPNLPGNILTAGAYSASGTNDSAAARGIVFATYVNVNGFPIDNVQVNGVLNGSIVGAGPSAPVRARANVYVFDTGQFTAALNNAVLSGQSVAQFLLGGSAVVPGYGADFLPDLSTLFPNALVDTSYSTTFPVVCTSNCAGPYLAETQGFYLDKDALFTVMFDVSAATLSAGNAQGLGIGNFLDTLAPDPSQGLFTDGNGNAISGIAGPVAVVLPSTPASIVFNPGTVSNQVGTTATLTATVTDATGAPLPNAIVDFAIGSGPHTGFSTPIGTDANGNATFTFTDTLGTAGTDSVTASIGSLQSNTSSITWTAPGPLFSLKLSPATMSISPGGSQTYTAIGFDAFNASLGDVTGATTFTIAPDGSCTGAVCTATVAGSHTVTGTNGQYFVGGSSVGPVTGTATLTVTGGLTTPTITFGVAPAPTYLGGNFTVSATTNSDGALTYGYVSGPCAQVSGGTFSSSGAGTCVVKASTAATTNYSAGSATQSVTITPATATITFGAAPTPIYLGGNFTVSATTNSDGALTYSYVSGPCAQVSGGTFSSSGAGTCIVKASTPATTNFSAGSSTQNVTISMATPTITFGVAPAPTYLGGNFTVSATTNSDGTLSYSYVSGPCAQVSGGTFSSSGGGICVVKASTAATANFSAGAATQSVTISPATPTVTFGAAPTPTYPGSNFTVSATTNSNGALSYSYVSGPCAQVSGGTFTPIGTGICVVQASAAATTNFSAGSATQSVTIRAATGKTNPIITWPAPAPITYGTPLSGAQLDATANVAGTLAYNPPAKTILTAGLHTLSVTFTPTNTSAYNSATATVTLQVNQATPPVLWVPVPIVYGTPLGPLQLDALTIVPGTFVYTPSAGTVLHAGNQPLSATFTPNDTLDFQTITVHATLLVLKATPDVDWSQPAAIVYGTPLSATQLDATANVPGTFAYNPPAGFILPAGTATLKVTFTPADTTDYQSVSAQVSLTVKSKK